MTTQVVEYVEPKTQKKSSVANHLEPWLRLEGKVVSVCISGSRSSNSHVVRAVAIELDVTADGTTIDASVKKPWDAFGHIDALINNACVRARTSLDCTYSHYYQIYNTNLKGFWLVSSILEAKCKLQK
ncbi:hypothetical protein T459_25883 [Capsicum annuum]|uniref:Uncharacterized protein n=1 Tax=Capsicum annuum TaxID=4072 RepID=A0A2G2YLZ8_CAPAN|nr:hypothetical protein T459_25883 [Capsicum annuum]